MVRTKYPKKQIIEVPVQTGDTSLFSRIAIADRQMEAAVASGDFYPNRSNNLCTKRWCGWHERCQREHGGVIPE